MISKKDLSELTESINDEIAPFMISGGGEPRLLAQKWLKEHRRLFRKYANHLAERSLTERFRRAMKKWDDQPLDPAQYTLPDFAQHLLRQLPGAVFVPPPEGAPANDDEHDDGEDMGASFRPVLRGENPITVGEARRALAYLRMGIWADQQRAQALADAIAIADSADAQEDETLIAALCRAGRARPEAAE